MSNLPNHRGSKFLELTIHKDKREKNDCSMQSEFRDWTIEEHMHEEHAEGQVNSLNYDSDCFSETVEFLYKDKATG
jgi:hypothetical protein